MEINKIYLGDSYELIKTLPDKSIDLIITDPPYEFDQGGAGGAFGSNNRNYRNEYIELYKEKGKTYHTEKLRIASNKQKHCKEIQHISKGFELTLLDEFLRVLKSINIYIWCSKNQIGKIINYFENKNCTIDLLCWHKTNPTPTINNSYLSDTEYLIYARGKGTNLYGSYETKKKFYITSTNKEDKNDYLHPTIKPIEIIENLVINSSKENDIVLDTFMGSGTTAVACKNLKRNYIGFEIDKKYYDISLDRINNITVQDRENKDKGILDIFDFLEDGKI